jgi:hypothetical protein
LATAAPEAIVEFLKRWTPFQLIVEASASHEWSSNSSSRWLIACSWPIRASCG